MKLRREKVSMWMAQSILCLASVISYFKILIYFLSAKNKSYTMEANLDQFLRDLYSNISIESTYKLKKIVVFWSTLVSFIKENILVDFEKVPSTT
jgi:hypothetical protein